jgi:hypothetical protein
MSFSIDEEKFLLNGAEDEILKKLVTDCYDKQIKLIRKHETLDATRCFESKDDVKLEAKRDRLLEFLRTAFLSGTEVGWGGVE